MAKKSLYRRILVKRSKKILCWNHLYCLDLLIFAKLKKGGGGDTNFSDLAISYLLNFTLFSLALQ